MLARDGRQSVGFATALRHGILSAYIPLLEVSPAYQGQGIGTEIMRRARGDMVNLYIVDVMCDDEVAPFYARLRGRLLISRSAPQDAAVLRRYRPALVAVQAP